MPYGDGTGPRGMGPMSGRGYGYCAHFFMPGYRCGFGRRSDVAIDNMQKRLNRRMNRRGFCNFYPMHPWQKESKEENIEMEKEILKNQAQSLQQELNSIQERLNALEKAKS